MRAQLLHLSGPLRGRTTTYEARVVGIGSSSDNDAVVDAPGVAPRHAQVEFVQDDCQFYLKRRDGQTFVNGTEVEELILQDGDQIELGAGGPMLRFRVYVPIGAVCKPVRRMLTDASDVARVSGGVAATQTLTRDLLTQASMQLKIVFPIAVIGGAFLAGWLGGWIGGPRGVTRAEVDALRAQQLEMRQVAEGVKREDLEQLRQEQRKQQEDLARIARGNATLRQIQREWSRGVCLMHGIYRLRMTDGSWFSPDGDPFEVEYTGSGFLVTAAGHVVTNRHVVAPWLEMPPVARLIEGGMEARFLSLTATFPGKAPVEVPLDKVESFVQRTDDLDVALVKLPAESVVGVPVLPLRVGPIDDGDQRAIVVGYPTGLAALLARADNHLVDELRRDSASMTVAITRLAASGSITPIITQGVVSNVQEHMIVYDAPTTHGGSGGPVFDGEGQVIAVNFAILPDFSGANFGVPIHFARDLLPK